MKNFLRKWLGINEDVQAIAEDINTIADLLQTNSRQIFDIFHALPFVTGVLHLTAADAARLTQPEGVQANSLAAIFTGVLMHARQGQSYMNIKGELDEDTRSTLILRGFHIEEQEGKEGKQTYIMWT